MRRLIFLALIFFVAGCAGPKPLSKRKPKSLAPTDVLAFLKVNSPESGLKIRGKITVKIPGESYSGSTTIQVMPDSIFWMNATKLGFEVFRLMVTRDSIQYIDRFNRMYFQSSVQEVAEFYDVPIEFDVLESLFYGNILDIDRKQNLAIIEQDSEKIHLRSVDYLVEDYWYRVENFTLEELNFENGTEEVLAQFADWQDLPVQKNHVFPYARTYKIPLNGEIHTANLEISKVEELDDDAIIFNIPRHYTRIDF